VVESFFAAMKREELYRTKFRSVRELKETIDKYMVFFNEVRPHATLNYKTPKHFEEEYSERRGIATEAKIDSQVPI